MKKVKILWLVLLAALTAAAFAACSGGAVENGGGAVPEYLGMTVSRTIDAPQQGVAFKTQTLAHETGLTGGTETGGVFCAYTGEDFFVYIDIDNPDDNEILSFTLNGIKYQAYQFEKGSTGRRLIVGFGAFGTAGVRDLTIDAVKYVDGETIRDARMTGDKTVKIDVHSADILHADLSDGTYLSAYSGSVRGAAADETDITYSVASGGLPEGLTLDADGQLSGTVTGDAGGYGFTVQATCALSGETQSAAVQLTVNKARIPVAQPTYEGEPLAYGGDLPTITTTTASGTVALNAGQSLAVGTENYNWTFTPDDTVNYENETGEISLTVGKAEQSIADGVAFKAALYNDVVTEIAVTNLGYGYEYSMDDAAWRDGRVFTDLTADTEYTFYARLKETGNYKASLPIQVTRTTTPTAEECFAYSGGTIFGPKVFGARLRVLTIPDYIDGVKVTAIGDYAFYNCYGFTGALTLPFGIESIGDYAFYNCYGFTGTLTIPTGVTSIGDYVFNSCSGLTGTLTIPTGVTSIGECAFSNCSGFTGTLTIPTGVTFIGGYAFFNCSGLTSITITNMERVVQVGSQAFHGANADRKIYVPAKFLDDYKNADVLSDHKNRIYAIPDGE